MKVMDVCTVEEGKEGKKWWHKVGTLFFHETDGKMSFKLFMFPAITFYIFERKNKDDDMPF